MRSVATRKSFMNDSRPTRWMMKMPESYSFSTRSEVVMFNDKAAAIVRVTDPSPSWCYKMVAWIKRYLLLVLTVLAIILGILIGLLSRLAPYGDTTLLLVSFPGEMLMQMLKMLILPLIIASLISGVANVGAKSAGRMGLRAVLYYLLTTVLATILGIILAIVIHPGSPFNKTVTEHKDSKNISTLYSIMDLIRNMIPENLVRAGFQQVETSVTVQPKNFTHWKVSLENGVNVTRQVMEVKDVYKRSLVYKPGMNIMGLMTFTIAFGVVAGQFGHHAQLVVDFITIVNDIIMKLVQIVMWYSPIGILSLIISNIMSFEDIGNAGAQLGLYMVTVLVGLFIHLLIVLPFIFFIFTRSNPFIFFKGITQAFVTALGTSSSSATLPVTIHCIEKNCHVDYRVARFVLPVGATLNMDGTALYEAVAAIFIAQKNGISLYIGELIVISITASFASIGAAGIPNAGLVTMILVLNSVGLPEKDISTLIVVDWILDRFRTAVNISGDAYGAGIVNHLCKDDLKESSSPPCDVANDDSAPDITVADNSVEKTGGKMNQFGNPEVSFRDTTGHGRNETQI